MSSMTAHMHSSLRQCAPDEPLYSSRTVKRSALFYVPVAGIGKRAVDVLSSRYQSSGDTWINLTQSRLI